MPIYVDADACPVKDEVYKVAIYKVARRYGRKVFVVANAPIRVPRDDLIELVEVRGGMDKADDWIAERAEVGDIVVTSDIPLADRCLARGGQGHRPEGAGVHRRLDRPLAGHEGLAGRAAAVR
jgi:uncharacterized protein YaiI (UPF0178 family)